jgi:excisionase family DNA binding protein
MSSNRKRFADTAPPLTVDDKLAFRIREGAAVVGLSRSTIYKLMAQGALHTVKVRGRRLIPRAELVALLHSGMRNESAP